MLVTLAARHQAPAKNTTLVVATATTQRTATTPPRRPTTQPQPTPEPTNITSDFITRVIARTNMYRAKFIPQCPQLTYNPLLTLAAYRHSEDMAQHGILSHSGSDGSTIPDRFRAVGYHFSTWAENITWYAPTPEQAVDDWFNETPPNDGHRRNILGCTLREIGVGFYYDAHDTAGAHFYWTEDFASPCNPACL